MNILAIVLAGLLAQNNAVVEGRVVKAGTEEAVSKAIVELRSFPDDSVEARVSTRDDGSYSFPSVRPGKYRVGAARSGYVKAEYGQRTLTKRGAPIEVVGEKNISGLRIAMTPTGVISGRIYGANGQPVIKANVQALKPAYQNGRRILRLAQTALSNDLGEYRLFWLPPGQYFIGVKAPDWAVFGDAVTINSAATTPGSSVSGMRFMMPVSDPLAPLRSPSTYSAVDRYVPVYFPNTTDDQLAQSVDLRPGAILEAIDIQLAPVRTRRVRGVVIDSDTGRSLVNLTPGYANSIRAAPSTDGATSIVNPATGAFEIQVVPGAVALSVASPTRTGRTAIPAGDADLDGVQIAVTPGFTIAGQIILAGVDTAAGDARIPSLRVALRTDPQIFTINPGTDSGVPSRMGMFKLQSVTPGDYRVNVAPILNLAAPPAVPPAFEGAYVKSIRLGDADVLNAGLSVGAQPPDRPLIIVVDFDSGSIAGSVVNDQDQPVPEATVVVVPDESHRARVDLYRSATTDAAGRFKLDRIPPGSYKLFAWDEVENGAWQDAEFMRAYEDRGKALTIGEGAKMDVRVAVIPAQ